MIQFNLLPDVKVQYIKTRRISRLVIIASILVVVVAVIATVSFYLRAEEQESRLTTLTGEADSIFNEIRHAEISVLANEANQDNSDINELLTIQAQLIKLTELHEQKVAVERIEGYLQKILPEGVEITSKRLDFDESRFEFSGAVVGSEDGQVTSLGQANVLIDTIKFTVYVIDGDATTRKHPFILEPPNLSALGGERTTFSLRGTFDPVIFDSQIDYDSIKMIVPPDCDTTHIEVECI